MKLPKLGLSLVAALATSAGIMPPAAFAATAEGGSTQMKAQPGCLNQWLFNGQWRVRVTKVAYHPGTADAPSSGWDVTMQWGNGTPFDGVTPAQTNLQPLVLALANGDTMDASRTAVDLGGHAFPPSGQLTLTQPFLQVAPVDQNNKPAKLLVSFDVAGYKAYHGTDGKFWNQKTPGYNYRFDLTCDKGQPAT